MTIDDQVNGWILEKFFNAGTHWLTGEPRGYDPARHGSKEAISVVTVDQGWECGCYSSWTRDDTYVLTATIATERGEYDFRYGTWGDFPSFLEELDEYINGNGCYYESEEYRDGSD